MRIVRTLDALRAALAEFRAEGASVALVPTMGALHAGHMALIDAALAMGHGSGTRVVASIFVNPRQFGPNEDLARYPRQEAQDAAMLEGAGCDLLWAPSVETMYPTGFATTVSVAGGLTTRLDGAARPGHFDGVATVVAKLFAQVRPDCACFGEKDFQQLAVVRRMAADLDLAVQVVAVPTMREADGLALSSRNVYLSPDERVRAPALPRALEAAARAIAAGDPVEAVLGRAGAALAAAGFVVDYVALVDAGTLGDPVPGRPRRLLAAARMGATRLIDNMAVEQP
ncbi:MAG TPA: pantoate--beta-alanine ligase [Sphingomonas sp.]|jgi:pantoate--beta-alanine ligase|uniref:pantoate--beta-alanine ligase n=1 Tax=Sphingomonas sp. TaxID=28214 RepID=UPI002EDAFEE3